jgi:hypothetical protein
LELSYSVQDRVDDKASCEAAAGLYSVRQTHSSSLSSYLGSSTLAVEEQFYTMWPFAVPAYRIRSCVIGRGACADGSPIALDGDGLRSGTSAHPFLNTFPNGSARSWGVDRGGLASSPCRSGTLWRLNKAHITRDSIVFHTRTEGQPLRHAVPTFLAGSPCIILIRTQRLD